MDRCLRESGRLRQVNQPGGLQGGHMIQHIKCGLDDAASVIRVGAGGYGCIAIITGTANFDVTVEGKDLSVELKFTSTWAKRDGRIQFIGWQATRVPPKQ